MTDARPGLRAPQRAAPRRSAGSPLRRSSGRPTRCAVAAGLLGMWLMGSGFGTPEPGPRPEAGEGPRPEAGEGPRPEAGEGPRPEAGEADTARRIELDVPGEVPAPDRATTTTTRAQMDERTPRSAPDALKWEPGVSIQKSAHGQASPYVRGLTGQQTALMFDGVRLNTSTFRQGPNQYFFTVDAQSLDRIDVVRGSASTRYGSDAIGGAIVATPLEPSFAPPRRAGGEARRWVVHPRASAITDTADRSWGVRGQLDMAWAGAVGLVAAVGYRDADELRSGGPIIAPATGLEERSPPAFRSDRRTQRGTGFREWTADARLVWVAGPRDRVTLAYYDFRQLDAPRADQCPPEEAPEDECLRYLEQFRTLVYAAWERRPSTLMAQWRATLAYQRQHELRELRRGSPSTTRLDGEDDVDVVGLRVTGRTRPWAMGAAGRGFVDVGADGNVDWIASGARTVFTDTDIAVESSRGQYVDGSSYGGGGVWADVELGWWERLRVRAGGRGAFAVARSPGDVDSASARIAQEWWTAVGHAGIAGEPTRWLGLGASVDQGFRAPNLDDLTSRQQTGAGFQLENPELAPERATSGELAIHLNQRFVRLDAWLFQAWIRDLITRAEFDASSCPAADPLCGNARRRVQLTNAEGLAIVRGVEAALVGELPAELTARATVAWTWGEQPDSGAAAEGRAAREPVSRIPPLHGSVELTWRPRWGMWAGTGVRWATLQDRLSIGDRGDVRIPAGGTPGYTVWELRLGQRIGPLARPWARIGAVFDNVLDAPYRVHGSSVNEPGRSLRVQIDLEF